MRKSNYLDIQTFEKSSEKVFPTIWLMVNILTFGQSIYMVKLMLPQSRRELSENFFHANVTQLISKLKLLNLIRNICWHNGDLVDISLKTMPKVSGKYRQYLNMKNGNYPHRLAVVITVLLDLMYPLNDKYSFKHLERIFNSLCEILGNDFANKSAQNMGFKNKESIHEMFSLFKNSKIITFYPDGSYIYK